MSSNQLSSDDFKRAMGCFPSGVTIVTTIDGDNQQHGFTASAFSSLSLSPPLVLVCLANSADCFEYFNNEKRFAINIISSKHEELALKFATKGCDKFSGDEFISGASGLPILADVPASLECETKYIYPGGDHIILVGEIKHVRVNDESPTVWHQGKFHHIAS